MVSVVNGKELEAYISDTIDVARAAQGVMQNGAPRITVPLGDGRVPDKVIGKVELFYFKKLGWVPKGVPLKNISQGKDAQEGFLHWMGLRCYQVVGGVFRFLIWQSIRQFTQADAEIETAAQRKREWLNPLLIQNPRDERFNTIRKIILKRRDLFSHLKRDAVIKCVIGVAIVASLVLLGLGALTYQPFFFQASALCAFVAVLGVGYFSLRKKDPFLEEVKEILATIPPEITHSSSTESLSSSGDGGNNDMPPPYSPPPSKNPGAKSDNSSLDKSKDFIDKPQDPLQKTGFNGPPIVLGFIGTGTGSTSGSLSDGFEKIE